MELQADLDASSLQIQRCAPGSITINNKSYQTSILLNRDHIQENWRPKTVLDICNDDWGKVISCKPAILIIGTGEKQHFLSPECLQILYQHQIGVEIMDTYAACRTLRLLFSDHRNCMGALIIP